MPLLAGPAAKVEAQCAVLTMHSVCFSRTREVNTPHWSAKTPEAGSSEYWEIGKNRRLERVLGNRAGIGGWSEYWEIGQESGEGGGF